MNSTDFDLLLTSVRQAGEIKAGRSAPSRSFELDVGDIKKLRATLDVTQREFALLIGVSVSTLRNWEQGRRRPEGPARALLKIVSEEPTLAVRALRR